MSVPRHRKTWEDSPALSVTLYHSDTELCVFENPLAQNPGFNIDNLDRDFGFAVSRPVFMHGPPRPEPRAANFQGRHIKKNRD